MGQPRQRGQQQRRPCNDSQKGLIPDQGSLVYDQTAERWR